jgi:uncharacterized membrane protein YhhN
MIALGCVTLVLANLQHAPTLAAIAKLTASTGFFTLALLQGAMASGYGRMLLTGLVCSWLGDAFLIDRTESMFLWGLAAFLFAHLAYVVAFSLRAINRRRTVTAGVVAGTVSVLVTGWLGPYVTDAMWMPVCTYVAVISVMVATAFGMHAAGGTWFIPLGATLFYISDLSVAVGQFVQPDFPNYVWGLPLYFAGQTLLALSVGRERPGQDSTASVQR